MDSDIPQPIKTEYEIELTPLALEMLTSVKDQRHQKSLSDRIDKLKTDPEKQGKPLLDKLKGYRSVRAVGQRYRIIYKVELEKVVVLVVGVGLRKEGDKGDIYTLLQRLLQE
ncbi:MAG: type II toxin-antitoxin system RelE/ParE family toxin [Nostoc sp.]|uniref:type II toxin-antitoxin system RelE family toxin n=1 Tax=Nostoc sp. TaxID=1180 RepID=UPI002FFD40B3